MSQSFLTGTTVTVTNSQMYLYIFHSMPVGVWNFKNRFNQQKRQQITQIWKHTTIHQVGFEKAQTEITQVKIIFSQMLITEGIKGKMDKAEWKINWFFRDKQISGLHWRSECGIE